jgi:ribosomal protein L11 methylase PrmA
MEISIPVTGAVGEGTDGAADDVAALVAASIPDAAAGVELRPGEVVFWVPRERESAALLAARRAVTGLAEAGQPLDPSAVGSRPAAPEAEWRDAWKRYFRTVRLTRQIVVVPSWDSHDPGPDDRVVHLDPGQAFGTGAHASTRLVLRFAQELADRGTRPARVLDLGTGSGILALAAAALWPAAHIVAVDNDPLAVATARENLAINAAAARPDDRHAAGTGARVPAGRHVADAARASGTDARAPAGGQAADAARAAATDAQVHGAGAGGLAARVQVSEAGLDQLADPPRFDLAMANIQADVLTALAEPLCRCIAPGGWLILSGLLSEQAAAVADRHIQCGMALVETRVDEEDPAWSALLLHFSGS